MRFILRKDIPTLVKGETGICLDSFSIITHTQFEGLRERSLKDLAGVPVTLLEEIRNFLNEAYADIKGFFIVKFIIDSVETPVATPNKTKVAAISIPARTGYTSAWQLNGTNYDFDALVTSDISLIAKYTAITYNITFNTGTDEVIENKIVTYDQEFSLDNPLINKEGCVFVGWYNGDEKIESGTWKYTQDLTLTAKWELINYTITYNLNGGVEETNPESYNILTPTIIFAVPTREGYTFDGWFDDAEFTNDAITELPLGSTGNVELWAKWTEVVED